MTGVLDGSGFRTNRLQRFGYAVMTAKENSMLFEKGESIPVHEFHYWDCTQNGTAFEMKKPVGNKTWEGSVAGSSLYAGFPHLYFLAEPRPVSYTHLDVYKRQPSVWKYVSEGHWEKRHFY